MPHNVIPADRDTIIAHLRRDAILRPIVDELPFPEDRVHLSEVYPSLLRAVVGQQVSTKAAAAIYRRFLQLFHLDADDPLAKPTPHVLAKADLVDLRSAGLSRSKAVYLQALADYFLANPDAESNLRAMTDEAAVAELTAVKGVGRWTAEMVLIFAMGRRDLLPLDDLAIYQSIVELYGLDPTAKPRQLKPQMTAIAEAWRPYRSVACLYLYGWRNHLRRGGGNM